MMMNKMVINNVELLMKMFSMSMMRMRMRMPVVTSKLLVKKLNLVSMVDFCPQKWSDYFPLLGKD